MVEWPPGLTVLCVVILLIILYNTGKGIWCFRRSTNNRQLSQEGLVPEFVNDIRRAVQIERLQHAYEEALRPKHDHTARAWDKVSFHPAWASMHGATSLVSIRHAHHLAYHVFQANFFNVTGCRMRASLSVTAMTFHAPSLPTAKVEIGPESV